MINEPTNDNFADIVESTIVVKEENVLIRYLLLFFVFSFVFLSGNPKQGLKLKIHKSNLSHTVDPKLPKDKELQNKYEISEMPAEERQHRDRMVEFLSHVERRN